MAGHLIAVGGGRMRRHAPWLASTLVGALLLGGCHVDNRLPDLPKDTPSSWRSAPAAAPAGLQPDLEHWWRAFGDSTLDGLVERALHENLNVKIAGERLRAARSLHHRSRSEFWPNLNFRVYPETAPGGQTGYIEMGFDSTWELDLFGRGESSRRTTLADLDTAAIDEAAARVSLIAEVVRDYVELRAAQARTRMLDDVVRTRQTQVTVTQARLRSRLAAQNDLDRANAELAQARADAADGDATFAQTRQALAVLLGTFAQDLAEPALDKAGAQPALPAIDVRETPADLLRTRPEIRRAEEAVLRAAGELGIARADLYPRFSIVGTLISSTALTGDLDRPNKAVPLIAPSVTIPILDWGARRDVVNAREAALSAAVLAYREAVLEGVAEADTALALFEAKTSALAGSDVALASADKASGSAATLRRIGLADDLDTANATLALAESRLRQSAALRERALSYVALYKSLGGVLPATRHDVGERPSAEPAK
jgi:NodT family efflux transporter outer membrane factor (OMF) lipoprotein